MAHETHDAIAHAVGEMVLQASGAEQVLVREPERARRALAAIQRTGREAVDELRQVLGILRAANADPCSADSGPAFGPASRRRYWPASADVALALLVLAVGAGYAIDAGDLAEHRVPGVLLQLAAAAAVALRRRSPFAALGLGVAAYAGEALTVEGEPGSPAVIASLLLVTYSAAASADRRKGVVVAVLALGVPTLVALVATGADAADVLLPVAIFGIPLAAGRAVAVYRRQTEELRILTERLASERDALTRLAVLDERAGVARELHDTIAHGVSVMVLQAGAAEQVMTSRPSRPARPPTPCRTSAARCSRSLGGCSACCAPTRTTARARRSRACRSSTRCSRRPPGRPAGRAAGRRRAGRAGPGRRRVRLPRHPGGADQRAQARRPRPDRGDRELRRRRARARDPSASDGPPRARHGEAATGSSACASASSSTAASCRARDRTGRGGFAVRAGIAAARDGERVIRILIADDQALVRAGLRMILDAQPDLEVVGEAGDGREALAACRELSPDLVLMDVRMPGLDGLEATRRLLGGVRPGPEGHRAHDLRHRRLRLRGDPRRRQRLPAQERPARAARRRRPRRDGRRRAARARDHPPPARALRPAPAAEHDRRRPSSTT